MTIVLCLESSNKNNNNMINISIIVHKCMYIILVTIKIVWKNVVNIWISNGYRYKLWLYVWYVLTIYIK